MKHFTFKAALFTLATLTMISCDKDNDYEEPKPEPEPEIVSEVTSASGDLTAALTTFRAKLGDPLNNTPNQNAGRREVNWDGVPASAANNNPFPVDFFNNTDPNGPNPRKRGIVYTAVEGSTFRVDSTQYVEIDPSYANEFKPFIGNGKRLIAHIGTVTSEATFRIPGTNTNAFVKGFGVVFSDVDDANSTTIQFYNGNKNLGIFNAPVRSDADGFSFLGVFFPNEKITRVKITAGNASLATGVKDISQGGSKDLVVMDDFFYDEPKTLQ